MNIELLAPAGSFQTMKAAIAAGADAVYMGGMKFGARAYAENGDEDTILSAIRYVHLHNKKLYLTVNTLLKNNEIETELYNYLKPLYEAGLDAVIVQDPGVLKFVKKHFPDMHIHASTQMTITGKYSAALLEEMGCSRIVTARELSLKEIAEIRKYTKLEIESFVHGALCYCYSGQCLMSSLLGGRSGNRGRCAQPCRLPYDVYEQGKKINSDQSQYALSPKDMCTVEILPEIIQAGVTSLKIEGRMKRSEYTAGVVRIYRKYLDLYFKNPKGYKVDPADLQELFDLYNRDGFHTGYYKDHNGPQMMAVRNDKLSKGQKVRNEFLFAEIKEAYIDKQSKLPLSGYLRLRIGEPSLLMVSDEMRYVEVTGPAAEKAQKQPLAKERILAQMQKTGNTPFEFEYLEIDMDEELFMPMQALNELRRAGLEAYEQNLQSSYERTAGVYHVQTAISEKDLLSFKTEDGGKAFNQKDISKGDCHDGSIELHTAVETKEQLFVALHSLLVSNIYASISLFDRSNLVVEISEYIKTAKQNGKSAYLALPFIVREGQLSYMEKHYSEFIDMGLSGYLVRSLESLSYLVRIGLSSVLVADANLYTYNEGAGDYYRKLGVTTNTAPYELNSRELRRRNNADSEMVVYGYQPLMVSAQCVKKNFRKCTKKWEILTLKDRYKKEFRVKCNCDFCYNVLYNSIPLGIWKEAKELKNMGFSSFRMNFTVEQPEEMKKLLNTFGRLYLFDEPIEFPSEQFTKGHLKRGVE